MRKSVAFLLSLFTVVAIAASCGKQLPTQTQSAAGLSRGVGATSVATGCDLQIGSFVWNDLNEDGIQDDGEPGIPGVELKLYDAGNQLLATVVTGPDGQYRFYEVCAGEYRVEVTPPAQGCVPTKVGATDNPYLDSNPNPSPVTLKEKGDMTIDFGFVCKELPPPPKDCGPCEGKVNELSLKYLGASPATVKVMMKKPKVAVFEGLVGPGQVFSFVGADKKGTLGTEIQVYVNGVLNTKIHTSCSQPIGPGLVRGDFEVVGGSSRNGGPLCPLPPVPPPSTDGDLCETYGRPFALEMVYTGEDCTASSHNQADGKVVCTGDPAGASPVRIVVTDSATEGAGNKWFDGQVAAGGSFKIDAANAGQTKLGTNSYAYIYFGQALVQKVQFHTSCSQPLRIGDQFGSLELQGFYGPTR